MDSGDTLTSIAVNMIVVIGNEKLTVEMQKLFSEQAYPNHNVTVLKIPRSPGVADLDAAYKERIQNYQLRNYFYGAPLQLPEELTSQSTGNLNLGGEASMDLTLSPHSSVLSFEDIHIYRIGQGLFPYPLFYLSFRTLTRNSESFAPSSALPIGASRTLGEMQPIKVDPSQPGSRIVGSILAVSSLVGAPDSEEDIVDADVIGFIVM